MHNILITGANRGLGLALTAHYLKKEYQLIACTRNIDNCKQLLALQEENPNRLMIQILDVACNQSIEMLKNNLGNIPINILINNAGIYNVPNTDFTRETSGWEPLFRTNVIGPYLMAHAFKDNVKISETRKIINISSYMASIQLNDNGMEAPYRASKSALNSISKNLALEFTQDKIICIAIDPGWVRTDMGGPDGFLSSKESAEKISALIEKVKISQSGSFYQNDGVQLPW